MYQTEDTVVFITGGAAGIGAGVVKAFLKAGAKHVATLDVDVTSGEALEKELTNEFGQGKIKFHKCDVTTDELNDIYDKVIEEFGSIDVVINNAGIMNDHPNVYLKEIAINVSALITSSFKAYDLMRKDHGGKGGTIINISSIVGLFNFALLPVYSATKSAVLQFSNCLGMEPHYSRSGVRVLTLCFGCTNTSLFSLSKMASFDTETNETMVNSMEAVKFQFQTPQDAVAGLMEAYSRGDSASTWLINLGKPAEDITEKVRKAYGIMSQGVFPDKDQNLKDD